MSWQEYNAKNNLVEKFGFTLEQAEAIVNLQLYKLTNTDVVALEDEMEILKKLIEGLKAILSDEEALKYVMKKELKRRTKKIGLEVIAPIDHLPNKPSRGYC